MYLYTLPHSHHDHMHIWMIMLSGVRDINLETVQLRAYKELSFYVVFPHISELSSIVVSYCLF